MKKKTNLEDTIYNDEIIFTFNLNSKKDERSVFANNVCKILVEKNKGNLNDSIKELKPIYDNFFNFVNNIYEIVDKEIPLFALYELITFGKDNWGFSEKEYQSAISRTQKACIDFYYR